MDEKTYHDILLKEYAEAGNLCRNCEQLTRTSLSVSLPLVSAIAGVLLSQKISNRVKPAPAVIPSRPRSARRAWP